MNLSVKKWIGGGLLILLAVLTVPVQAANIGSLPLFFEASHDQSGAFIAHGRDSQFSISSGGTDFTLRQSDGKRASVRMSFIGAQVVPHVSGGEPLAGKINYFDGNDPSAWQTGIPAFQRVHLDGIYPGVNATYYGNEQKMEYDLDLAAGVSPATIVIRFDGAKKLSIGQQGELVIDLGAGKIVQHQPVAYQNDGVARHDVQAAYRIMDADTVTFALGTYDHSLPLVIDPVLGFSTFFGGNAGEAGFAIALDSNGYIYVAGQTLSTSISNAVAGKFPTIPLATNAFQTNFGGGIYLGDAFVAKFYPNGTNFVYFTYLGGSADDQAQGLAVDGSGNAYITGYTDSTNFPTKNAIFTNIGGSFIPARGAYLVDAFVTELGAAGTNLIYSTYLGGAGVDFGTAITVDNTGTAYVVGCTTSTNFPFTSTTNYPFGTDARQKYLACTNTLFYNANAFLAEIAPGGTSLNYCSYFGGTNFDEATAVTLDGSKDIYVAGFTLSTNFPVTNYLSGMKLLNNYTNKLQAADAFVARFKPNFASVDYCTYLGGTNYDEATGITVDGNGTAYVVGWTTSSNFPSYFVTTNATNVILNSFVRTNITAFVISTNAFLSQIFWNGTSPSLGYSQMFGGAGIDVANGVALDPLGNVYLVGSASSLSNYPAFNTVGGLRATNASVDNFNFYSDVVVTAFKSDFSQLLYSGYIGGAGADYGNAIAVDSGGNAYLTGQTLSTNYPTFQANWPIMDGTNDAFLTKIANVANVGVVTLSATRTGTNVELTAPLPPGLFYPADFTLQGNTNLLSTNWVTLPQAPVLLNGLYSNNVPFIVTNHTEFFRLKK